MPNPGLSARYFKKPHGLTYHKILDLNRKFQVDTKLGESFCYLPYLGISKTQNVRLNTYYDFSNELVCLSEL